jgi:hypothetical protein
MLFHLTVNHIPSTQKGFTYIILLFFFCQFPNFKKGKKKKGKTFQYSKFELPKETHCKYLVSRFPIQFALHQKKKPKRSVIDGYQKKTVA